MYLIDKDTELTTERLARIIQDFMTGERVKLEQYHNYYKGNQAIMRKTPSDVGKPCNRIVTNYCYNIVQNYQGYLTGVDISYSCPSNFEAIQDILNYNDVRNEDNEYLRNALIYGKAYEINYIDENSQQRFKVLDSRECIPVYDNTLNQELQYVIRFYLSDTVSADFDEYYVEVYSANTVKKYRSSMGFSSFTLLEETPHFFKQVPITVFSLNAEEVSIFDKIITLQDAYNNLVSAEVDDFEAFCDAYLVLKGCTADNEDLQKMKQNRVLIMDTDASAEYLTKSVSDTQIQNMLDYINDNIHKIANSPDFNDDKFMSASGISMRYKLTGFENVASNIVAAMTKALQRRIELICGILNLAGSEAMWRDVEIVFTRNLPVNTVEIAQMVNNLRGLVSDETLIAQLPFIQDPAAEMELVNAQKQANMEMYSFTQNTEEEDTDNE